jgi:predicted nucleic acid-binding protein
VKPCADTNFFTALITGGPHGEAARQLQAAAQETGCPPLPVTFLTRMEVTNAIQLQVFFTRSGVPGIHSNPELALLVEMIFTDELARGESMIPMDLDLAALESTFDVVAHRHTAREGFRTYDILHVSTALLLGCDTFWSFDAKAKKLAKLEGLTTN